MATPEAGPILGKDSAKIWLTPRMDALACWRQHNARRCCRRVSTEPKQEPTGFQVGDLEIDIGTQRVVRNGVDLPLQKLSFELLLTLARAAPNFISFKD